MKKIIFFILPFVFCSLLFGGNEQTIKTENPAMVTFDSIASAIEKSHNVKLFYKPDWFEGRRFRSTISELSIENSLNILCQLTQFKCIQVNSTNYVFVPSEIKNYSNLAKGKGPLVIGYGTVGISQSKATVYGKIIDLKSGDPLKGAFLKVDKVNVTSQTDKAGNYSITVPVGEYKLTISYPGYEETERIVRIGGNGIVDFEIAEKSIQLKEIEVRDRAANMNVIRTQMSSIKLTAKTIKELPTFLGEKDIIKSMNLLPGVQSTGEFGTGFFVRGGSSDQNLILVEGVPLFNSSHLFGLNSVLNPDGVSNATFMKAGFPARYGERASSILDIKLGNNPEKISFKGGIGLLNTRLNLETPLFNKRATLLIGGRSSYSNWLLHAMPDASLKNSSASFYDINFLLNVKLFKRDNLSVFGYLSDDEFSFVKNSPYHYDNKLFSVKYQHYFNQKLNFTLLAGQSQYRNEITDYDSIKPKLAYKISSQIKYNNFQANFNLQASEHHNLEFGATSILYNLNPGDINPFGNASEVLGRSMQNEKALEMAVYLSDNINLSSKLGAEIGVRFNNYAYLGPYRVLVFLPNSPRTIDNLMDTLTYGANEIIKWNKIIEPRVSLRYTINDNSSVKLSYNKVAQFINLISNTTVMSPTDVYKMSGPNVDPLICNQIALGYFRNFNKNEIEASLELYYKKLDNIVEYRDGATILLNEMLETQLLKASGYNYGAELYIKKNTGKLTGWASYTFSRSMRRTTSNNIQDQINGNKYYPSPFDKPHNFVITGNYHLTRRWWLSGTFTYNTGKPVTLPEMKYNFDGKQYVYFSERNKYRLEDYHRLDLAVTLDETLKLKQKWKGSWTFSLLNAYGHKNAYSVFYKSTSQLESKYHQFFNLYNLYIIKRPIPTITYNFSF